MTDFSIDDARRIDYLYERTAIYSLPHTDGGTQELENFSFK